MKTMSVENRLITIADSILYLEWAIEIAVSSWKDVSSFISIERKSNENVAEQLIDTV